jgi:ubiquinol-cytochrome c reductase cytochrome c subunit
MRIWRTGLIAAVIILSSAIVVGAHAQDGGDPARGGELYVDNCLVCHGAEGQGRVGASLTSFPGIDVNAALRQTITRGIQGSVMPAWGEEFGGPLSDQDVEDIVAYIQASFVGSDPIAPAPTYQAPEMDPLPEIEGDPSLGAVVYMTNCEMCHGPGGRGRFGAPLAKLWPGVEPAVYVAHVTSEGIEGSTMPAWAQSQGGPLSQDQIEDVTAYILSLEPLAQAATPTPPGEGPLSAPVTLVIFAILLLIGAAALVVYYRQA